jgi:DNA-binding response OmpR family regulator
VCGTHEDADEIASRLMNSLMEGFDMNTAATVAAGFAIALYSVNMAYQEQDAQDMADSFDPVALDRMLADLLGHPDAQGDSDAG